MKTTRLNNYIKILSAIFLHMHISIDALNLNLKFVNENWSKFSDIEKIKQNTNDSFAAIMFYDEVIDNYEKLLAETITKVETEHAQSIEKNISKGGRLAIFVYAICCEKFLVDFSVRKNKSVDLVNQSKQELQSLFSKYKTNEEVFAIEKLLFHIPYSCGEIPSQDELNKFLSISHALCILKMVTINLMHDEKILELKQALLETNKQTLEKINKADFEKAINALKKESLAQCEKSLRQYKDQKLKSIALRNLISNDQIIQEGQLKETEYITLCARLREAENNEQLLDKIIDEANKIIAEKSVKTKEKANFKDYLDQLGYQ